MKCRKCGEEILEGSMFCNKCGTKILVEGIKIVNSDTAAIADKTHAKVNEEVNEATKIVVKKKFFTPVKVVISTVIVVAIAICCMWYLSSVVQPKYQAIADLKAGKYTQALNELDKSLESHSSTDTILLKSLAENCISLYDNYNNNNFPGVVSGYDKLKSNSNFDLVSTDINKMYNIAKKKPELTLKYGNGTDCTEKLVLSNGSTKFGSLDVLNNGGLSNVITFEVVNNGINPAETVVADFKFNNMYMNGDFTDSRWESVSHDHGMGWTELKYSIKDEPLYNGVPQQLSLDFNTVMVGSDASITVTLLSKDCTPKKIKIPVEIK